MSVTDPKMRGRGAHPIDERLSARRIDRARIKQDRRALTELKQVGVGACVGPSG